MTNACSTPATSKRLTRLRKAGGTRAHTYDAAGNVTFNIRTGGGYTYDAAGRMSEFTLSGFLKASEL